MKYTKPMLSAVYTGGKVIEIERHDTYVDGDKKKEVYKVTPFPNKEAMWKQAEVLIKTYQSQGKPVLAFGFHEFTAKKNPFNWKFTDKTRVRFQFGTAFLKELRRQAMLDVNVVVFMGK